MWEIKEKPTLAKLKEKLHKSLEHFLFMSFSKEIIKTQNDPVYLENGDFVVFLDYLDHLERVL